MKRQHTELEKVSANDKTDKGLISKIYKQLIHLNNKEIQPPPKKWTGDLNRHFSKEYIHMISSHMERCSTLLIIREMQIKTVMRYQFTSIRMAIMKKLTNNICWTECGEKGTILHCWWECKLVQSLWETVWRFLRKLKIELPYASPIPLLEKYLDKTIIQKDTFIPMFIAALFTIVKSWKQSKCP